MRRLRVATSVRRTGAFARRTVSAGSDLAVRDEADFETVFLSSFLLLLRRLTLSAASISAIRSVLLLVEGRFTPATKQAL